MSKKKEAAPKEAKKVKSVCEACEGAGFIAESERQCPVCDGSGLKIKK